MTQPLLDLIADPPERDSKPLVTTDELLRIGMQAGRQYIEQPRPTRKRRDKLTISLFDTKEMF